MEVYDILFENMERLEKKLTRIRNKCARYGCDFTYEKLGEIFKEITLEDGTKITAKFVQVQAQGVAVVNGWQFVASVEHTENGNIINRACDIEVPERYYNSKPFCEHCNSKRARKDTYIVVNTETGDFKQVGKSCLRDFTGGMDAELVTSYTAMFDELIKGEQPCSGTSYERYTDVKEFLHYVAETIKYWGYVKRDYYSEERTTLDRACDYYSLMHGWITSPYDAKLRERLRKEMDSVNFNHESEYAKELTKNALLWLSEQNGDNNYMHNLKTACGLTYDNGRNLGIVASLFMAYNKDLERKETARKKQLENSLSTHVGEIGKRIEVSVKNCVCVTSWESNYGYYPVTTYIWKITDENGNIFTWKTSNTICGETVKIKGTVKAHNDYKGTKQTELTRCACLDKDGNKL